MHREEERLRHHEDAMRQHLAQSQQGQHHIDPTYGQRSHSASSHGSAGSARAYAQYMAMQQYQCPSPPPPAAYPVPPQAMNGHATGHNPDRPPVPDPPDFSQTTIAGYEQLALELSSTDSAVKPIYRKFEYLNHRILLHLQDELSEMEEQLRTLDEIVAQMEPCPPEGQPRPPASRRGDAFQGSEMHHRRTALLGRIFLKTEQYNRAMASYNSMGKDARAAEKEEIGVYREWLQRTGPVHEVETRFLMKEGDLVVPGSSTRDEEKTDGVAASPPQPVLSTCLPVGLMLPLVLFAFIPTLVGRLFVTSLIAVGAFLVASTTEIRDVMPSREWAVCAGVYVLVMAFIAGVMPQYGGS
ncbi:Hypothetical predicted protein [Lecanosticta acicola]|uniref:DUF6594 domain-containing protein n=1 Tax=Lecanosticta acicola TaxID=111012 RepID=A0AAI8YV27_9PEZI|nr:Hypothetical predicted protein [Lecanosticta acicola]